MKEYVGAFFATAWSLIRHCGDVDAAQKEIDEKLYRLRMEAFKEGIFLKQIPGKPE